MTRLNLSNASGKFFVASLVVLGSLQAFGSQEVRIGPFDVPGFSVGWLVLAGMVAFFLLPRSSAPPPRHLGIWSLLLFFGGALLLYWSTEIPKVPSPLLGVVHRETRGETRPERNVVLEELAIPDRRSLWRIAGLREQVRLTVGGFVRLPSTGTYRFNMRCDDYCVLRIGERLIGEGREVSVEAALDEGTYPLQVEYRQLAGPALLALDWDRPGGIELLPMRRLVSGRSELLAPERLFESAFEVGIFIVGSSIWWLLFGLAVVRSSESRQSLGSSLVLGWNRFRQEPPEAAGIRVISLSDGVIIAGFVLCGVIYQFAHLSNRAPYVILYGDAANIATFAAARDHPELFKGDELLGDPDYSGWYPTIHVRLIRALAPISHDYGMAFMSLLGLHTFLLGTGFYVLGRVVFTNRYWAFLLAVASMMYVELNLGEFWGLYRHPIPRTTFQAVLPFVAAAAYKWRRRTERWPFIMIAAGLLIYVHPVSAPAWGLAFWLGLLVFLPDRWRFATSVGAMLSLGVLFLTVTVPMLWHYLGHQDMGAAVGSYAAVHRIIAARFQPGYLDLGRALEDFCVKWASIPGRWIIWPWACFGAAFLLILRRRERRSVCVVLLWLAGILLTSVVLPGIDLAVARANHSFPVQYDLVRGIRYLIPFLLLFSLWPLAEMDKHFHAVGSRIGARSCMAVGALLVAAWCYWHPPISPARLVRCWLSGRIACGWVSEPVADALRAVRELVPPGSPILATELQLPIRYFSLRPSVWSYKDGGVLAYVDHDQLMEWNARKREISIAILTESTGLRLQRLAALARRTGARFLFLKAFPIEELPTPGYEVLWMNEVYALVALHDGMSSPPELSP